MSLIQRKRTEAQKEKINDNIIKRRGELVSQKVSFGLSTKEKLAKKMGKKLTSHQKESIKLSKQRVGGTYGTFANID